ncbi:SEC-C metal-binding domain-containing protein [Kibdelosporangium lantanae]|uniref:SEC-C metal-binding domain-containing protein n=1 Tax=Kibdelosporangium lantanae TaxID=1497396 RepID=A0ABW3MB84_9PSEU
MEKLGGQDPCPCGSGRRFRRCCRPNGRYDGVLRDYYVRD